MIVEIKHFDQLDKLTLYKILELRNKVFVVEQACIYQDCDGKDVDAYHLTATEDTLAGYLRILKPGVSYDEVSIGRVLVSSEHRGTQLGRKIMLDAIAFIRASGYPSIRISAQVYLKKFYESLGFEQVSDEYLEDDIPHMEMFMNC